MLDSVPGLVLYYTPTEAKAPKHLENEVHTLNGVILWNHIWIDSAAIHTRTHSNTRTCLYCASSNYTLVHRLGTVRGRTPLAISLSMDMTCWTNGEHDKKNNMNRKGGTHDVYST